MRNFIIKKLPSIQNRRIRHVYIRRKTCSKNSGGIVASRFNEFITSRLLSGALDCLRRHEVPEDDITVAWVPGAFEIPLIASRMAASRRYDAVICLGAVIRGSTSHYDYVCSEVSKGIAQTSLAAKIPVMFGVLTTETLSRPLNVPGPKQATRAMTALREPSRW